MDADNRFIPRSGPMFSRSSPAKAQMATDLAIPILADGGWPALAWFPSVAAMRAAVAAVYGDRWIRERGNLARARTFSASSGGAGLTVPDVALALLPQSWLEEVFDGIWSTIVEAGRWDDAIGSSVTAVRSRERDLTRGLLEASRRDEHDSLEREVELVLTFVHGFRRG